MENKEKELLNQLNRQINQLKINLKDYINNSYDKLSKNRHLNLNHIEEWKSHLLSYTYLEINKLELFLKNNESNKMNEMKNKKEIIIESINRLNCFTSKDIQDENKEITRNFQNEAYNYMNSNEKKENENVAIFLKEIAKISRISFNEGKKLFQKKKEQYIKLKGSGSNISLENENSQKEFSSWVKDLEKETNKKEYEKILNQINILEKIDYKQNKKFLLKLFYDLTIMYFHCFLAFPSVKINFEKKDDFISDKMIDFINRGKNRKVNFIILPALISNGNFLQNGKSWVFTYTKTSFKFDDVYINKYLNELINTKPQDKINIHNIKNSLKVKVSYKEINGKKFVKIDTNYDAPEKFIFNFYLLDKQNNKIMKREIRDKKFELPNYYEIKKYELLINKEKILSSNDVIKES